MNRGRYAAFAYYHYYPAGGMHDCVGTFPTKKEAWEYLHTHFNSYECLDEVHDLLKSISKKAYRTNKLSGEWVTE